MYNFDKMFSLHVEKQFERLCEREYQIDTIFKPITELWPGDWEGRALLAFCNIYLLTGKKTPALEKFFEEYPKHCNAEGFLGEAFRADDVNEQQLSGHGWLLDGLVAYYRIFKEECALQTAKAVVENLFLRIEDEIDSYPIDRNVDNDGAVSGHIEGKIGNWRTSTDIGCAFISMDGLSEYYTLTKDARVKNLLDRMAKKFLSIDKLAIKAQTHATLTATRALLNLYAATREESYLRSAQEVFALYEKYGMTYTYENFNWFQRFDTWTEPCAIVDSLIVATTLYKETKDEHYRTAARRIWFNGLHYCHRSNGGAGPNSCVCEKNSLLKISMYEAPFCCTMRYASGLVCVKENRDLFDYNGEEKTVDEVGRRFVGDILLIKDADGNEVLLTDLAFPDDDKKEYSVIY